MLFVCFLIARQYLYTQKERREESTDICFCDFNVRFIFLVIFVSIKLFLIIQFLYG